VHHQPTDKVLPKGIAAIVRDLVDFLPVRELFQAHLARWEKKNELRLCQRRKAEARLASFWVEEPKAPDSDEYELWPARTIFSPDRSDWKVIRIPLELNRRLEKSNAPGRYRLLHSLDARQDFSRTESFALLAKLHNGAYENSQIGGTIHEQLNAAEAVAVLEKGMSQPAVQNLAAILERVLDVIEVLVDSASKNQSGKTLRQIIQRSREALVDLRARSQPPHSVTPLTLKSVLYDGQKSRSEVEPSVVIPVPPVNVVKPEQSADRIEGEPVKPETAGASSPSSSGFAAPTDRVPDEYWEQGQPCGPLERGKTALARAVTRNRKAKPDQLKKHHGKKVFVREISPRNLEVFFRSFRELNAAREFLTPANSE
jgi:hypothetical protein